MSSTHMSAKDGHMAEPKPPENADGTLEPASRPRESADATKESRWTIMGLPMWVFFPMFLVIVVAVYTDTFPSTLVSGFAFSTALGLMLMWIGQQVPFLKDFGLPIIMALFVPAIFVWQGLIPANTVEAIEAFTSEQGAWDFILVAIIAGAILGMPRKLIIKAGLRFAIPVLGVIGSVFLLLGVIGSVIGYGFGEAIFFVAGPIMGGGLPLGAIPMSEMYAQQAGGTPGDYLSLLISAVLIANIFCVVFAAIVNGVGKRSFRTNLWFCGDGQLLRVNGDEARDLEVPAKPSGSTFIALGQGLLIAGTLYIFAVMLNAVVPSIHQYAWLTLVAAAIKIAGFVPDKIEEAASQWGDYATITLVPALLASVSVASIDIGGVVDGFTDARFITLVVSGVLISAAAGAFFGFLVRFYAVESAVVPGLIMADTGGSGDVAVLSAAERMHLLPFATVATRIGGAFVLVLTSALIPVLGGGVF